MHRSLLVVLTCVLCLGLTTVSGQAQCALTDDASDAIYNDGWDYGDNGGIGFQPWILGGWGNHGHFIGNSTANDGGDSNGDGDINTAGDKAWGMWSDYGEAEAIRPFNVPLAVGQVLTVRIDNGWLDEGHTAGISLRNAANENRAEVYYRGWDPVNSYKVNDAAGEQNLSPEVWFTGEGVEIEFTLTGPDSYTIVVTRLQDGLSATHSGTLAYSGDIDKIRFFTYNPGSGGSAKDFFLNSLEIAGPGPEVYCWGGDIYESVQCGADTVVVAYPSPFVTNGCPPYTITYDPASGSSFGVGSTPVTCTVEDSDGFTDQCAFNVIVTAADTTPPTVNCPAPVAVECPGEIPVAAATLAEFLAQGGSASDNCPGDLTLYHVSDIESGGGCAGDPKSITRQYRVYDLANNYADCSQSIVQEDNVAPILSVPANVTVECGASTDPAGTGQATATDNCGDATVGYQDSTVAGTCPDVSVITRTWEATDACGNLASAAQIITVQDTTPPSITCDVPAVNDPGFESGDVGNWNPWGNTYNEGIQARTGSRHIKMYGNFNDPFNYSGFYQELSASGGQVWRASAYVMAPIGDAPQGGNEGILKIEFLDAGHNWIGVVESDHVTSETPQGIYIKLTVTATAPAGTAFVRIVGVYEQEDYQPGAVFFDDMELTPLKVAVDGSCQAQIPDLTSFAVASDGCSGVTVSQSPAAGTVVDTGEWGVTLTATDDCGNSADCALTVNVVLDTAPAITCPADVTISCDASTDPNDTGLATAEAACASMGDVSVGYSDSVAGGACPQGATITRAWYAIDSQGNLSQCVQTITLEDGTAPVLSDVPADLLLECAADIPPAPVARAWAMYANNGAVAEAFRPFAADLAVGQAFSMDLDTGYIDPGFSTGIALQSAGGSTRLEVIFGGGDAHFYVQDSRGFVETEVEWTGEGVHIDFTLTGPDSYSCTITRLLDGVSQTISGDLAGGTGSGVGRIRIYNYSAGTGTAFDTFLNSISIDGAAYDSASDVAYDDGWQDGDNGGSGWGGPWALIGTTGDTLGYHVYTSTANDGGDSNGDGDVDSVGVRASDNCDPHVAISFSESSNGATGCAGNPLIITRTWTAVDDCGNVSSQSQVITQEDAQGPELIGVPADITVQCIEDAPAADVVTATDNCDGAVTVVLTETQDGDQITRTWTAEDGCGNVTSASQLITAVDTTPPILSLPEDATVECDASSDPAATGSATASDNCDAPGDITITYVDSVADGACAQAKIITRTWIAEDLSGNVASGDQAINVVDTTPPEITAQAADVSVLSNAGFEIGHGPGDHYIEDWINFGNVYHENFQPRNGDFHAKIFGFFSGYENYAGLWQDTQPQAGQVWRATAYALFPSSDPITGDAHGKLRIEFFDSDLNLLLAKDSKWLDASTPQDQYIQLSVTEVAPVGTDIIRIVPTFTQTDGTTPGSVYFDDARLEVLQDVLTVDCLADVPAPDVALVTADDSCDLWPVIEHVSDTDNGGSGCAGDPLIITRTYRATDACGNAAESSVTIVVEDSTAPELTVPEDVTIECDASADPADTGEATATDNCDGAPAVSYSDSIDPLTDAITRTWTATDACGNSASGDQVITVIDSTAPSITCPADVTLSADANCEAILPDLTEDAIVADNCGTNIVVSQSPVAGSTIVGTTAVTLTATDEAGNSASCTLNAIVEDVTAPSIACPADITLAADANCQAVLPDLTGDATASDNCSAIVTITQSPAAGTLVSGTQVVTLTATDEAGNSASCTVNAVVVDQSAPSIVCPDDVTLAADESCGAAVPDLAGAASVSDNCSAPANISVSQAPVAGAPIGLGTTPVILTAMDEAGNVASCSVNVDVVDTTAPSIACPGDVTLDADENCQAVLPDLTGDATVSDNCSATITVSQSPAAGTLVSGATTVTLTATDESGNSASCTLNVDVVDVTAPSITCPADVTLEADAACEAVLPDLTGDAIVSDNCSATITVSQSPAAGTLVSGATTVTLTATDESGNSASCTLNVDVVDVTAPVISSPGDQTVAADCSFVVEFEEPTATDNCDGDVTVVCSPASGDVMGPGVNTITCTATDSSGNTSTTTFTVTVIEPLQIIFLSPLGDDNVADDIETDLDDINKFKVGRTIPVKAKILDCSGNDVTVAMAPSITVRIDVTERASAGSTSTLVNDLPEDYNGVGDPASTLVLVDSHLQYNLDTDGFNTGTIQDPITFFRVHLTVEYNSDPLTIVGEEDATLESK